MRPALSGPAANDAEAVVVQREVERGNFARGGVLAVAAGFGALAWAGGAGAVELAPGTTLGLHAVTHLREEWTAEPSLATASFEHTEQLSDASSISSVQTRGIDALPNPSCAPPCVGLTAEATSAYEAGGLTFTGFSHAYADFDATYTIEMPPTRLAGFSDGNIVIAESNAAVLDVLTITSPVQLQLQGSVAGEDFFMTASDSALYENELPDAYFGVGDARASLIVNLTSGPPIYYYQDLQVVSVNATIGQPHVVHDVPLDGSATVVTPGDYLLKAQLRTYTRIGTVNGPTLSVQDMTSDFSHTASFRLVADDPSAVTSASGQLTFTVPEPSHATLEAVAALLLALGAPAARRRRSGCALRAER